jgi:von Willebrand factor type A domain
MPGRHRPSGLFGSRAVRLPMIIIGALSLIGLATIVLRAVNADAEGCSAGGIRLTVAADPAIAPAIAEIGTAWTATHPTVEGDCVRVDVTAKPSYEMSASLGTWAGGMIDVASKPFPTPSDADLPLVWIPESSYWLGRVRVVDREMFDANTITSVASSPIVLAVPEELARGMEKELGQGVDAALINKLALDPKGPKLKLGLVEPRRDTAGMIGAMALADAVVASQKDLPKLVKVYRSLAGTFLDTEAAWKAMGSQTVTGMPVSEQALLAYNAGGKTAPVAAVPLADAPTLDFPYAARAHQPVKITAAAAAFRTALIGSQYRSILAQHRLRLPDGSTSAGFPTGHGVTGSPIHVQALTDMNKIRGALTVWNAARTPSRIVAMVDATQSMSVLLGAKPRMQVMREAALTGLALFSEDSQLGLWAYAGPGSRNLVPLNDVGPANSTQRAMLAAAMNQATPAPTDICPLYQSIVEGYKKLLDGYNFQMRNTLVVFTDGQDSSGQELRFVQKELELLADVTRPIRVVLLGLGPDINLEQLQGIAETTGGAAFQVNSPDEMQAIFLMALLS